MKSKERNLRTTDRIGGTERMTTSRSDTPLSISNTLPRMDSNHDKQIQNLQCYRYTTRQYKSLIWNIL